MLEDDQEPPLPGLNFEQMLALCGDRGRYQLLILFLFGYINLLVAIHFFTQTVATFVPDHWCYHEKLANMSFKDIEKIYSQFKSPSCTKLDDFYDVNNVTVSEEPCTRWFFDHDYGFKSMNAELNWVCHEAYHSSIGRSFFFVGAVVGTLIFGSLADIIGRLPVVLISNLTGYIGDVLTIFTRTTWYFSLCRFIAGLSTDTDLYLMQVIVIEYIHPKWRTMGLNLMIGIFFFLGIACIPGIAVLAGSWKGLFFWASLPTLSIIFYFYLVQESALWLLTRNNLDGAIRRLKSVAKTNRREVTDEDFKKFRRYFEAHKLRGSKRKKESFFDLLRAPHMRRSVFILLFESIVMSFTYDGVSRNMEDMGISPLVMFSATSVVILPGSLLVCVLQERIGRKGMASISMLFAGIFSTITAIVREYETKSNPIVLMILIMAARTGAAASYDAGQQYATEIIPSSVRAQSVAAIHIVGFAASSTIPFVLLLGKYFKAAPPLILGIINLIGSFLYLFLPETTKKVLPKTIEEAEGFGEGETMCYFVCCRN